MKKYTMINILVLQQQNLMFCSESFFRREFCVCVSVCCVNLKFEFKLRHDRSQQHRIDGKQLLDKVKDVL